MVRVRATFNISKNFNKQFDKLSEAVVGNLQKNFSLLREDISNLIDEAVEENRSVFIPTDEEAGELGIGEDERIDREKTLRAWTQLKAKSSLRGSARPTTFSVTRLKSKTGIGTISIKISEDKFYKAPLSIVETESDIGEAGFALNEIPWMQWFINGKTISGSQFSKSKKRNLRVSRTGRGIMIGGGVWSITPRRPNPIIVIGSVLEKRITDRVKRYIEQNAS